MSNANLLLSLIGSLVGDSVPSMRKDSYDEQGNLLPGKLPYNDPGWATKFFHPDVATSEVSSNDRIRQLLANRVNESNATLAGTKSLIGDTNLSQFPDPEAAARILSSYGPGGQPMFNRDVAASGARNEVSPLDLGKIQARTGLKEAMFGEGNAGFQLKEQPKLQNTQSTINTIAGNQAAGSLNRSSIIESILDSESLNRLSEATGIEPLKLQEAKTELERRIGRQAITEDTKDIVAAAQQSEANVQKATASTREGLISTIAGATSNNLRTSAAEAAHPATMPNAISFNPKTQQLERNPLYMPMVPGIESKLGVGTNPLGAGNGPTLSNGLTIGGEAGPMSNNKPTMNSIPERFNTRKPMVDYKVIPVSPQPQSSNRMGVEGFVEGLKNLRGRLPVAALNTVADYLSSKNKIYSRDVIMNALQGKHSALSPDDVVKMLQDLSAEEQDKLFRSALGN